jgi:heme-degrading monooxygenase HmoA
VADPVFGIVHRFQGGTEEQYRKALGSVHPPGGLPEGQLVHAAGQAGDEWVVIALWDSEDSWVRFRDETLLPGLQQTEGGFQGPPRESTFQISNYETS